MAKDDVQNMMALDVYLSSLSDEEYAKIKDSLRAAPVAAVPLQSWDVTSQSYAGIIIAAAKIADRAKVQELSKKHAFDIKPELLQLPYQALVLTDATLKILWVNHGFTGMTGYSANFAIGKKPIFLQGANTSHASRAYVRQQLNSGQPFKAEIINYRKNQEEYLCEVNVYPLTGKNGQITHYFALEKEIA